MFRTKLYSNYGADDEEKMRTDAVSAIVRFEWKNEDFIAICNSEQRPSANEEIIVFGHY